MEKEFEELIRSEGKSLEKPYYYGIRIYVGPDGVPRIEQFGNIKKAGRGKVILSEETEPIVDVMTHGDEVWVVADLPGVDKDKIKVNATEKKLYIRAEGDKRKYYKEVDLPVEVDPSTAKASYRNGVLEVRIKKKEGQQPPGVEVKVE
ncbi:MAG: Hsp20/alpha crystallin family protein [Acidilobus sp.]|nr:Hsp20/alpha crystallin family protein [Acidilobus sp.]